MVRTPISPTAKALTISGGLAVGALCYWIIARKRSPRNGNKEESSKGPNRRIPPGPQPSDQKMGNLGEVAQSGSLHAYLARLHEDTQSDVVTFWYGPTQCCSVASADTFKQVKNLFDRPPIIFEFLIPFVTTKSIQFANGEEGKFRRQKYADSFSHSSVLNMIPSFNKSAEDFLERVKSFGGECFDSMYELKVTSIKALAETMFGDYFREERNITRLIECYDAMWAEMEGQLVNGPPEAGSQRDIELQQELGRMREIVNELISSRQQKHLNAEISEDSKLFIDNLIQVWGSDNEQLYAECTSFMVGGFHTSAGVINWTLYYCTQHPEIQDRMAAEAVKVIGKDNLSNITAEQVASLKYCRQVYHEAIRASVLVPFAARFNPDEDIEINGYNIPAGMPVLQALGISLMDPKVWPDPEKFDPERFCDENAHIWNSGFSYQPFGFSGKRKCLGYRFAYMEGLLWLAKWMGKGVRFSLDEAASGPVERNFALLSQPKNPIYLKATFVDDQE